MNKQIKDLELLSLARQYQKSFNRDYRLQKKGLYEQSEDLLKPLLNKQDEFLEAIAKQTPKETPKLTLPSIQKVESNNSFFIEESETENQLFLRMPRRNTPQMILDKHTGDLTILTKQGEIALKNTEGLSELLFSKSS